MREIKFRAWVTLSEYDDDGNDKDYFAMANKISVHQDGDIGFSVDHGHEIFGDDIFEKALENETAYEYEGWCMWEGGFELMQYTGLKDKNGKEIYEGDILQWTYRRKPELGVVSYVNDWGAFIVDFQTAGRRHLSHAINRYTPEYSSSVIGNIYENPELLGDKL